MIKILFIGNLESYTNVEKHANLSTAGLNYQFGLLKELSKLKQVNLKIASFNPMRSFPKGRLIVFNKKKTIEGLLIQSIAFINLPLIKYLSFQNSLYRYLSNTLKKQDIDVVICFNYYSNFYVPIEKAKNKFGFKILPILADLPIIHLNKTRFLEKIFKKKIYAKNKKVLTKLEYAVALNKNVIQIFCPNAKYIVIEGGIELNKIMHISRSKINAKSFIYAGTLDSYSGILNFIDAFIELSYENDITLSIYGTGELVPEIIKKIKDVRFIDYHGRLNQNIVVDQERKAFCLVNPKIIENEISEVTFPSKIHEYLANNPHIMSTRLRGVKEDYFNFIIPIESDSLEAHRNALKHAINTNDSQIYENSKAIKNYVQKSLSWEIKAKELYEFLKRVL